jgi:hypothetical protein
VTSDMDRREYMVFISVFMVNLFEDNLNQNSDDHVCTVLY